LGSIFERGNTVTGSYRSKHLITRRLQEPDAKGLYPSDHFGVMTTYDVKL
jgi:hypothetical protein